MAELGFFGIAFWAFVAAFILQSAACTIAWRTKRVDIVDVFWGLTFITTALVAVVLSNSVSLAHFVVPALVLVWGLRLSWHISTRFRRSQEQDPRYTEIIKKMPHTARNVQIYVRIFIVQAILAWIISLPVLLAAWSDSASTNFVVLGSAVWLTGFIIEMIADKQLAMFLARPDSRGKLMMAGLWRYSRHPNYFGEVTQWWGIWLITLTMPYGLLTVIGPITITILITKVSGIPLAEKRSSSKPEWEAYRDRTSVLIPLPPKA